MASDEHKARGRRGWPPAAIEGLCFAACVTPRAASNLAGAQGGLSSPPTCARSFPSDAVWGNLDKSVEAGLQNDVDSVAPMVRGWATVACSGLPNATSAASAPRMARLSNRLRTYRPSSHRPSVTPPCRSVSV
jgi:hypothetical protein